MNKLILIFEDEVVDIDKYLIFNNELDALDYLEKKGLTNIKFNLDLKEFHFKVNHAWSGMGQVFYAKQY